MSKGKSTTTTTTDPTQMAMYEDLYGKAKGIAQQPFVPYTGGRVAGFNPDQLQGFDATRGMFNQSMGFDPRSQLNNLANMSTPSVNLPFGYNQPQPSPILQPAPMPITGGGRPTPPPSIGGIGGGGPVMPSSGQMMTGRQSLVNQGLMGNPYGNRVEPILTNDLPMQGNGLVRDPYGNMVDPNNLPDNMKLETGPRGNTVRFADDYALQPSDPGYQSNGRPQNNKLLNISNQRPVQSIGGLGGRQDTRIIDRPGVTVPRPDPIKIGGPVRRGPQPTQTNPFSPTQLGSAAMQNTATVRPVERFDGANISPIDLYSGASVNRGDVRDVTPTSLLDTNLDAYQNPFQSQVIDNTLGDLNRARQLQIQSDQDAAIGRGAFGGSRSALLESETNRNFAEQAAKTAGNLRAQGFDRATGLAGQDIGRQFDADRYMSDADRAIAMQNASFGQQAGLAKQGLLGDVSLNQAKLNQQAGLAGMDASNRAGSQQAQLDASRFGANQNALNQFGLQQGQFDNQMNMGMFDAANRAAFMQPELEMQNRGFQASLLGDQLSDQYRNLGLLSGIGSQQQGLQQAGMDAGYNEFLRAIGYGPQQLNLLAQGVSALPTQSNVTQSNKPGFLDQAAQAAAIYSGFGF